MSPLLHFFAVSSFTAVLLSGANYLRSSSPVTVETSSAMVFGSHVRLKVVQYFDTLEDDRLGLTAGPGVTEVAPGKVLAESERKSLTDVPKELVRVLPECQQQAGYYIAGSYLIVVDSHYKILDSILIPALHRTLTNDREMVQWVPPLAGAWR